MELEKILEKCGHTLLAQGSTWDDIRKICDEGMKYHTASVCIPPYYVTKARELSRLRQRVFPLRQTHDQSRKLSIATNKNDAGRRCAALSVFLLPSPQISKLF